MLSQKNYLLRHNSVFYDTTLELLPQQKPTQYWHTVILLLQRSSSLFHTKLVSRLAVNRHPPINETNVNYLWVKYETYILLTFNSKYKA